MHWEDSICINAGSYIELCILIYWIGVLCTLRMISYFFDECSKHISYSWLLTSIRKTILWLELILCLYLVIPPYLLGRTICMPENRHLMNGFKRLRWGSVVPDVWCCQVSYMLCDVNVCMEPKNNDAVRSVCNSLHSSFEQWLCMSKGILFFWEPRIPELLLNPVFLQ